MCVSTNRRKRGRESEDGSKERDREGGGWGLETGGDREGEAPRRKLSKTNTATTFRDGMCVHV